ncbi:hypothetical protein HDU67_000834, partial [Dinochytrium kinnereticum]
SSFTESILLKDNRKFSADVTRRKSSSATREGSAEQSDESSIGSDKRRNKRYPITLHQLQIYQTLYLEEEEDFPTQRIAHQGPPFYISQAYRIFGSILVQDLALAVNKVCSAYKVLCTRFWRNEKIVDGDVEGLFDDVEWDHMEPSRYLRVVESEEYPELAVLKPQTVAKFIRKDTDALDRLERGFQVLLIREPDLPGRKAVNYIVLSVTSAINDEMSTCFIAKEIFSLYFECARYRVSNDSDFQIYSVVSSHSTKEEADDFIDVAYGMTQPPRQGHLFWKEVCVETVQDAIEGPERDDIEAQLRKTLVEVENLRTQVQSLSKRKTEMDNELGTLKEQRRQMEVESFESVESYTDLTTGEVIEISKNAKSALIRTVLGEEAVEDNISALLSKHDVAADIQRNIGHMRLEVFSQITEDQLSIYGLLAKDRRKILALSEYVRNRIKESLQEQAKVKYALERKIMKLQRELDMCASNLKVAQNSLDANDDMGIRLKVLLNPPSVEVRIPALGFEDGQTKSASEHTEEYGYHNLYGFQAVEVDVNVLKNIRRFRDRCRQTHKQRLLNLRKGGTHLAGGGGEFSDFSSTEESNPPSEAEDNGALHTPAIISSDSVCLAAFQVMLKHIMGADKFLLGVKTSFRRGGVLVGPLSDIMPLRVDMTKKGVTFNSLLVSAIKGLRELKKQGGAYPYPTAAKRLKLPETFPVQFEFITDRESQQWGYAGMEAGELSPKPNHMMKFDAGLGQPAGVERVWSVDERAGFDVKLVLVEVADGISGGIVYRKDRFDDEKIAKWVQKYQTTLEGIEVGSRDVSISSLISRYYSSVFLNKTEYESQASLNSLNSQASLNPLS